jgi:hypothetical protein
VVVKKGEGKPATSSEGVVDGRARRSEDYDLRATVIDQSRKSTIFSVAFVPSVTATLKNSGCLTSTHETPKRTQGMGCAMLHNGPGDPGRYGALTEFPPAGAGRSPAIGGVAVPADRRASLCARPEAQETENTARFSHRLFRPLATVFRPRGGLQKALRHEQDFVNEPLTQETSLHCS